MNLIALWRESRSGRSVELVLLASGSLLVVVGVLMDWVPVAAPFSAGSVQGLETREGKIVLVLGLVNLGTLAMGAYRMALIGCFANVFLGVWSVWRIDQELEFAIRSLTWIGLGVFIVIFGALLMLAAAFLLHRESRGEPTEERQGEA